MPAVRLGPEGLLERERLAGLTRALFEELLARGAPFVLKSDYLGVPPPIEELDLVHLVPVPSAGVRPGTLVLDAVGEGFEYRRVGRRGVAVSARVARVVAVERPGAYIRLDAWHWRLLGRLLVLVPAVEPLVLAWRRLAFRVKAMPGPPVGPVALGPVEDVVAGIDRKRADPLEISYQAKRATDALEAWETDALARVPPTARDGLVIRCGAGREALALARRGFTVTATDPVPAYVDVAQAIAEREGVRVVFETRPTDDIRWSAASFDLIWCPPWVYEQIPQRDRRVAWLGKLAHTLRPDGVLVLCAGWHRERGPRRAAIDVTRWALRRISGGRFPTEPGDRRIRHFSLASDASAPCFWHAFQTANEIRREIHAAGLDAFSVDGAWIVTGRAA